MFLENLTRDNIMEVEFRFVNSKLPKMSKDFNSLQFISNGLLKWILFIIIIIKALTI